MAVKQLLNRPIMQNRPNIVPIDSVKLLENNPWKHDKIIPRLAEIMAVHGQVTSVVVWDKNDTIYKGNHTKKALLYLKKNLKKISDEIGRSIPDILSQVNPDLIKVEWHSFPSETVAMAYALADNNVGQGGEYDDELTRNILLSDGEYFNTTNTGFTEKEMKSFILGAEVNKPLEDVNISGDTGDLGEFGIVLFKDSEQLRLFREGFGLASSERKVDFSTIIETMTKEWQDYFKQ